MSAWDNSDSAQSAPTDESAQPESGALRQTPDPKDQATVFALLSDQGTGPGAGVRHARSCDSGHLCLQKPRLLVRHPRTCM